MSVTAAIIELRNHNHLTATKTSYPGTDRILRFEIKNKEASLKN